MNNEIAVIDYSDSVVLNSIKDSVAIGATDAEFTVFIEQCRSTGLNPYKKEIWFIKVGNRAQIMTGAQGFHQIANKHPQYDGFESGFISKEGNYLPLAYPNNDYIGAWCRVYRKDRSRPMEGVAFLAEYDKKSGNWNTMKRVMICKCAESIALRKSFSQELNGLYTAEEMPIDYSEIKAPPASKVKLEVQKETIKIEDADIVAPKEKTKPNGEINWSAFEYRYHLPVKKVGVDMDKVRAWLKGTAGFFYCPDDQHWYGDRMLPKIAQYLRPKSGQASAAANAFGDDDIQGGVTSDSDNQIPSEIIGD